MLKIKKYLKSASWVFIVFFFTLTIQLTGQEAGTDYLFKERISGFTIEKKDGQNTLPVDHGVELEISSAKPLNTTGDKQIKITLYTDGWFLNSEELNTFFVKDFRGALIFTPGSILAGKPTINLLSNDSERKQMYSPEPLSLDDLYNREFTGGTKKAECEVSDTPVTILPVQIPSFNDDESRIRAFELLIPVQITNADATIGFYVDRIELGGFIENAGSYGTPSMEDYSIMLTEGDQAQADQTDDISPLEHQYILVDPPGAGSEWKLTGGLKQENESWNLSYLLRHNESDLRYSGITGIEMILMTPDGAVTMESMPVFRSITDNLAFEAQDVQVQIREENPELSASISERAYLSSRKQVGFGEEPRFSLSSYDELLFQLWRDEAESDYFRIPMHISQKQYPIVEGPCGISIQFLASIRSNPFPNSRVLFKLNYLAGNDKGMLKRHTAILKFADK